VSRSTTAPGRDPQGPPTGRNSCGVRIALLACRGGTFIHPRPQTSLENCTWHTHDVAPTGRRYVLVAGNYQSGISVVDFTNPGGAVEIAYADPAPLVNTSTHRCRSHPTPVALARGGTAIETAATRPLPRSAFTVKQSPTRARLVPRRASPPGWPQTASGALERRHGSGDRPGCLRHRRDAGASHHCHGPARRHWLRSKHGETNIPHCRRAPSERRHAES
jgi:hypothetical protein